MRGWYTNAPLMGELRKVPHPDGGETLRFSDEYEDWKDTPGNVEVNIHESYTGAKIADAPVGTWVLVVENRVDCEPFATLRDAKAYATQGLVEGWYS